MMKKILMACATLLILSLQGCGPTDEEARKLGFENSVEMKALQKNGFKTKLEYEERYKSLGFSSLTEMLDLQKRGYQTASSYQAAKSLKPDDFYKNCKLASREAFDSSCKGKKIIWKGEVVSVESAGDGVRIKVLNEDGSPPVNEFKIDSKSLASQGFTAATIGRLIDFEGTIAKQNSLYPDIEPVTYFVLEQDAARDTRVAREKIQLAERERADAAKAMAELEGHLSDAEWLSGKFSIEAGVKCQTPVERLAKFDFQWTDGTFELKFPSFLVNVRSPGVLTVVGDKIKFQNGFGAWQHMKYFCDFDVRKKQVIDVSATPRG
jgi:hypothetical protein